MRAFKFKLIRTFGQYNSVLSSSTHYIDSIDVSASSSSTRVALFAASSASSPWCAARPTPIATDLGEPTALGANLGWNDEWQSITRITRKKRAKDEESVYTALQVQDRNCMKSEVKPNCCVEGKVHILEWQNMTHCLHVESTLATSDKPGRIEISESFSRRS